MLVYDNNGKLDNYQGYAYIERLSLLQSEEDGETCPSYDDGIPIQLDVVFGNSWACPSDEEGSSNTIRHATIESQAPCTFWNMEVWVGREYAYPAMNTVADYGTTLVPGIV